MRCQTQGTGGSTGASSCQQGKHRRKPEEISSPKEALARPPTCTCMYTIGSEIHRTRRPPPACAASRATRPTRTLQAPRRLPGQELESGRGHRRCDRSSCLLHILLLLLCLLLLHVQMAPLQHTSRDSQRCLDIKARGSTISRYRSRGQKQL